MKARLFHVPFLLGCIFDYAESLPKITAGESNYTGEVGENKTLQWKIDGDGFDTIKWSTYNGSKLVNIWVTDENAAVKPVGGSILEHANYTGRLSASRAGNDLLFTISKLKLEDNNKYLCSFVGFGVNVDSPEILLIVNEAKPTSSPPTKTITPDEDDTGLIVGLVIAGVVVVAVIIGGVVYFIKKNGAGQEGISPE